MEFLSSRRSEYTDFTVEGGVGWGGVRWAHTAGSSPALRSAYPQPCLALPFLHRCRGHTQ